MLKESLRKPEITQMAGPDIRGLLLSAE